ncbi:heparinase II/III domain-containing protein [Pseudomonas laurentiana]
MNANGELRFDVDRVLTCFQGEAGVYQLRCVFDAPVTGNGYSASFRLDDWAAIQYVAIGYTAAGQFVHIKVRHVIQGEEMHVSTSHGDLAFLTQNEWGKKGVVQIQDLRIFIKGTPMPGAVSRLSVYFLECWEEEIFFLHEGWDTQVRRPLLTPLLEYWEQCFPGYTEHAEAYMRSGVYPVDSNALTHWDIFEERPRGHDAVSTNRFSWHALHAVSVLLLAYSKQQDVAYLFAARDMTSRWIEQSYLQVDPDQKYTWYDHGTAERTVVFVALWQFGLALRFDYRFMARLASVLFRHTQLLASDAFYALHQPTPYHNHACFQDVALIAAAACQSHISGSAAWVDKAERRLQRQLRTLVHQEQHYAVFTENSIGYHSRMQELAELAGALLRLSGQGDVISHTARLMRRWSLEFMYPDGHWPCHGDSFRKLLPCVRSSLKEESASAQKLISLPETGYSMVKGSYAGTTWMLGVVATNLNPTHKQQDDLSCFLWLDGVEWLTDPSFYSHEYQQPETAYLRSPRAHNMLHVPQAGYCTSPDPSRASLTAESGIDTTGIQRVIIRGINCAHDGVVIQRTLYCAMPNDMFTLQCSDRFELEHGFEVLPIGELSFHMGEGVVVTPLPSSTCLHMFSLSHSESRHTLTLGINIPVGFDDEAVQLEPSFSGTTFLEKVPTTAIRVRLLPFNVCTWTLNVSAS